MLGLDPAKMRRWQETSRLAPDADPVEVMQFWLASNRPNLKPKPFDEAIPAYIEYLKSRNAAISWTLLCSISIISSAHYFIFL